MKYFWDTLLDADLESDILGWQYISGGLPDGHELERLDNPEVCHVFLHSKDLQFAWYHSDVIILYSILYFNFYAFKSLFNQHNMYNISLPVIAFDFTAAKKSFVSLPCLCPHVPFFEI